MERNTVTTIARCARNFILWSTYRMLRDCFVVPLFAMTRE